MPQVVPLPLGGLATEIGTINDQLLDLEFRRVGASITSAALSTSLTTAGWTYYTGWPSVSVGAATPLGFLIFAGANMTTYGSGGSSVAVGVSVDSATPTQTSKGYTGVSNNTGTAFVPQGMSLFQWTGPMGLGFHTFEVQMYQQSTPVTDPVMADPYLVVVPL